MKLRPRLIFISIAAMLVMVAVLLGGTSVTAYAAQSALPGDSLYRVKTTLEKTEIALARSAASRANLDLSLAQRRLNEISALIAGQRYNEITSASAGFETAINQAMAELDAIAAKALARVLDEALDPRPVWVTVWGGPNTLERMIPANRLRSWCPIPAFAPSCLAALLAFPLAALGAETIPAPGTTLSPATDTAGGRSLPLCSYPNYPRYKGGPLESAESYESTAP